MRPTLTVEDLLGTRSRVAVLRVLRGVRVPLNASQIAARTGLTRPAVATVLDDLARAGVVQSSPAGRANIHWLVRDNAYVTAILEPLFSAEEGMPRDMVGALRDRFAGSCISIVLFGSYARGDQDPDSDVDIALVSLTPESRVAVEHQADDYAPEFRTRYGATLSPLVYDPAEAAALAASSPALMDSLVREGIVISGMAPWEWAAGG